MKNKLTHSLLIVASSFLQLVGNAHASRVVPSALKKSASQQALKSAETAGKPTIIRTKSLSNISKGPAPQYLSPLANAPTDVMSVILRHSLESGDVTAAARLATTSKLVRDRVKASGVDVSQAVKEAYQHNKPFRQFVNDRDASSIMPYSHTSGFVLESFQNQDIKVIVKNFMERYPEKKLGYTDKAALTLDSTLDNRWVPGITFGGFEREVNQTQAVKKAQNILKGNTLVGIALPRTYLILL